MSKLLNDEVLISMMNTLSISINIYLYVKMKISEKNNQERLDIIQSKLERIYFDDL